MGLRKAINLAVIAAVVVEVSGDPQKKAPHTTEIFRQYPSRPSAAQICRLVEKSYTEQEEVKVPKEQCHVKANSSTVDVTQEEYQCEKQRKIPCAEPLVATKSVAIPIQYEHVKHHKKHHKVKKTHNKHEGKGKGTPMYNTGGKRSLQGQIGQESLRSYANVNSGARNDYVRQPYANNEATYVNSRPRYGNMGSAYSTTASRYANAGQRYVNGSNRFAHSGHSYAHGGFSGKAGGMCTETYIDTCYRDIEVTIPGTEETVCETTYSTEIRPKKVTKMVEECESSVPQVHK